MKNNIIPLECLGISELMLIYFDERTNEDLKKDIMIIIDNRIKTCEFIYDEELTIYNYELYSINKRINNQNFIFKSNTNVQDLFDFFFKYLKFSDTSDAMIDELIISRNFKKFIRLELMNINNRLKNIDSDINDKNTLNEIRRIFNMYKDYDYEEVYVYLYELNPYYYRSKTNIDNFVKYETKLMNKKTKALENMIASGEYVVDYEKDVIFEQLDFNKGIVLPFKTKVKNINSNNTRNN